MTYKAPEFKEKSFNCPICNAFSHMDWYQLGRYGYETSMYYEAKCSCCAQPSLWRVSQFRDNGRGRIDEKADMIFPDNGFALPALDMPEDVKKDYLEAASIFSRSPRGAAALLRLGLQKLCKHLGQDGKNINTDIRNLAAENILPPLVVQVADTVRITGNNAVHPGEMSEEDFDNVSAKMFDLLNFIVKKAITEPAELKALYELTPEGPRKSAEQIDAKA